MKRFIKVCRRLGIWLNVLAGTMLYCMMALTITDIVLRYFGKPLMGTYELVAMTGALVIGFATPKTSLDKGHTSIDMLIERASEGAQKNIFILTRIPGIILFVALAYFLFLKGYGLCKADEVSLILGVPNYPIAYVLAFCCFVESLVLVTDIFGVFLEGEMK